MKNKGLLYGIIAYTLWGFLPIYWKFLQTVSPVEILVHRVIWSLVFLVILLTASKRWKSIIDLRHNRRDAIIILIAALLLALNWFVYIWGVNSGYIVETSLGYFINPLVNVLLGVAFLQERLRPAHWLAVGIAAIGVLYLTVNYGSFPWIALTLAITFGIYGLLTKKVGVGSAETLTVEMMYLFIPALIYLITLGVNHQAAFGHSSITIFILLLGSGAVTAIPLIFFAAAAQRVPLSTMGLLQYIAPTFQFLIGVFIYGEPFTVNRLIGFIVIWVALLVYTYDNLQSRKTALQANLADQS